MANDRKNYTAAQIVVAARDLQDAAGASEKPITVSPERTYTLEEAVNLLSEEIRLLRERGFSNERIADLFTGFEIEASTEEIERFYERDETLS